MDYTPPIANMTTTGTPTTYTGTTATVEYITPTVQYWYPNYQPWYAPIVYAPSPDPTTCHGNVHVFACVHERRCQCGQVKRRAHV